MEISQKSSDGESLAPLVNSLTGDYGKTPAVLAADSAYGSEENLALLKEKNIKAAVKFTYYNITKNPGKAKNPFLHYNEEGDYYICPMGQKMDFKSEEEILNESGYVQKISTYEARRCQGCHLLGKCHKPTGAGSKRKVSISHNGRKLREEVIEYLDSEEGRAVYQRRSHDVETAFADIKHNMGYKRFTLRGLEKVNTEMGLVCIAHNLKKMNVNKVSLNFSKKVS